MKQFLAARHVVVRPEGREHTFDKLLEDDASLGFVALKFHNLILATEGNYVDAVYVRNCRLLMPQRQAPDADNDPLSEHAPQYSGYRLSVTSHVALPFLQAAASP